MNLFWNPFFDCDCRKRINNGNLAMKRKSRSEIQLPEEDFKNQQEKHKVSEKQRRLQTKGLIENIHALLPGGMNYRLCNTEQMPTVIF